MTQNLQTGAPVAPPQDGLPAGPPLGLTAFAGLAALRGLSGLVWTAEALRIAEAIALLPESGGEVMLPAAQLDRVAAGLSPAPRDTGAATVEILIGMATVLALAAGRMTDGAALARPFSLRDAAGGMRLQVGGAGSLRADQPARLARGGAR